MAINGLILARLPHSVRQDTIIPLPGGFIELSIQLPHGDRFWVDDMSDDLVVTIIL